MKNFFRWFNSIYMLIAVMAWLYFFIYVSLETPGDASGDAVIILIPLTFICYFIYLSFFPIVYLSYKRDFKIKKTDSSDTKTLKVLMYVIVIIWILIGSSLVREANRKARLYEAIKLPIFGIEDVQGTAGGVSGDFTHSDDEKNLIDLYKNVKVVKIKEKYKLTDHEVIVHLKSNFRVTFDTTNLVDVVSIGTWGYTGKIKSKVFMVKSHELFQLLKQH
jgi:hypothetical protein